MKKSYNEENYKGIIKILNNMPRINAPDNFEFNLMTRIENKNFDNSEEKKKIGFAWKLTPALAIFSSVVILFLVWNDQNGEFENPLMKLPPSISEVEIIPENNITTNNDAVAGAKMSLSAPAVTPNVETRSDADLYKVVVRSNDVVSREKVPLNLNAVNTIDLDNFLNGELKGGNSNNRSRLVGGGETFEFNGFYIKEQTDRRLLESIKSRVDSIRSVQNDSLSKRANLPQ